MSVAAEASLLGAVIHDRTAFDLVADVLAEHHFSLGEHRDVWRAVRALKDQRQHVDLQSAQDMLRAVGNLVVADRLPGIVKHRGATDGVRTYASQIRSAWSLREAENACHEFSHADSGKAAEERIRSLIGRLQEIETGDLAEVQLAGDICRQVLRGIRAEADGAVTPDTLIPSGLRALDNLIVGFEPGVLSVFAARPGVGKSTLATKLADSFGMRGIPTSVFWLEDGARAFGRRAIAARTRLRAQLLRKGSPEAAEAYARAAEKVEATAAWPIWLTTSERRMDIHQLCGLVRRLVREKGIKVFIADHLGEVKLSLRDFEGRHDALGDAVRAFRDTCREMGACPILMVQENRQREQFQNRDRSQAALSYIANSGEIEQVARLVGFLSSTEGTTEGDLPARLTIDVRKNTNGPRGQAVLDYYPQYMTCDDPESLVMEAQLAV